MAAAAMLPAALSAVPLFDGGRSEWAVVVPEGAPRPVIHAAEELTNTVSRIAGAALPVVTVTNAPGRLRILLVQNGDNVDDVFSVRTAPDAIMLKGSSPRAVLFAAYAFLRDCLGVRWYWPGEDGTFLPPLSRYEPVDWFRTYRSPFRYREMSICDAPGHRHPPTERWFARQFLNCGANTPAVQRDTGAVRLMSGHFVALPSGGQARQKLFDAHPDWFSLINGKRDIRGIAGCWSSDGYFRYVVANLVSLIRRNGVEVANMFVADITSRCECGECTRDPDRSARWWNYYARLVDEVRKEIPGQKFAGLAYMEYRDVPGVEVRNLEYVEYCQYNRCYFHALGDAGCPLNAKSMAEFKKWGGKAPLALYGYEFDVYRMNMSLPIWRIVADEMEVFREMGLKRVKTEYATDIPFMHGKTPRPKSETRQYANRLSAYLWASLAFDPAADADRLVADFCEHVYGAGAAEMKAYHDLLAETWGRMPFHVTYFYTSPREHAAKLFTDDVRDKARRLLAAAADKTRGDSRASAEIALDAEFFGRWEKLADESKKGGVICDVARRGGDNAFDSVGWGCTSARGGTPQPTRVKVYRSDTALNLMVECAEKENMDFDRGGVTHDDPGFNWEGDSIECFLDVGDGSCRQIAVSPAGGVWDAKDGDTGWDSGAKALPVFGNGVWTMSISLPFGQLGGRPEAGARWKLMIIRNARKGSRYSSCGWPVNAHRDFSAAATLVF